MPAKYKSAPKTIISKQINNNKANLYRVPKGIIH